MADTTVLTRQEFNKTAFERDKGQCVVPGCERTADVVHHIIERRLWLADDPLPGGYHLHNAASLCGTHHLHAENGYFPPQALRHWIDLPTVLPKMFDNERFYDKWGNPIPPAPQKIKYPRTLHLPFSPASERVDRYANSDDFLGKPLVVTVKMDGSCVRLNRDGVTARNGESADHASFDLLKQQHASIQHMLPANLDVFGEWLLARHSIAYEGPLALPSYLMVFAVYDRLQELFYSVLEVIAFCKEFGLSPVPCMARPTFNEQWRLCSELTRMAEAAVKVGHEGVVVRNAYPFHYTQFSSNVAKFVRANHVQTDEHWSRGPIVRNELKRSGQT